MKTLAKPEFTVLKSADDWHTWAAYYISAGDDVTAPQTYPCVGYWVVRHWTRERLGSEYLYPTDISQWMKQIKP